MKKLTLASLGLSVLIAAPAFAVAPTTPNAAIPPAGTTGAEGIVPPSSAEMGATTSERSATRSTVNSQRKRRAGNNKNLPSSRRQGALSPDSDLNRDAARSMRDTSRDTEDRGTTQGADAASDWRRRTGEPLDDRSGPMNTPQPSDPVSDNISR